MSRNYLQTAFVLSAVLVSQDKSKEEFFTKILKQIPKESLPKAIESIPGDKDTLINIANSLNNQGLKPEAHQVLLL